MNERKVFIAALQIESAAQRRAYLEAVCGGDEELRREVEALLTAHERAGSFLEHPLADVAVTTDDPIRERPGTVIGPYKLMEQIGEGGMGLVFVAEQQQPIRRKVALKVIKPGMDSRQVVARFEAERQALALMDHANIAKVFDGGATDSGRPYFVMELVKGVPITEYCDQNQVSIRQRLELFVSVCQAVQHAHQKGIIHRDIKPSNVLVMSHDGTPVVKIIDFGVAKAIGQQLTDKTIYTQFSQMVGTPLYMSPEQAGQSGLDVDTRSDIYSLGVLLYELLTGTTPFDKERLREMGYDEMRRIIREEEPPRPSTRISTLGKAATTVSMQRQSEPKQLSRLIHGELDWIAMKALEKDRNRRYETASGFAADVQRYLHDEPVLACPPSLGYRLRKSARKHRAALVSTTAFVVLLVAGLSVSLWQMFRAIAAEEQANQNAQQAREERDAKDVALKAEQQARADETKARQQAFAALRSMTTDVVERKFTQGAALTEDDRAFLRGVIAQYDAFAAIHGDDADSREMRASGRFRVAQMRQTLGELKEAEQDFDQAVSIRKQLAAEFPSPSKFRGTLAMSLVSRGALLSDMGRFTEAEKDYDQSVSIFKQLAAEFPSQFVFRKLRALNHNNRGNLLRRMGRVREAEKDYDQSVSIYKQLAAEFPSRPAFRQELARSHLGRGVLLRDTGRLKEAEQNFDQSVSIRKQLVAESPSRPENRRDLAASHVSRGILLWQMGRFPEAEKDDDQSVSIFKQLAAEFPSRPQFRLELAKSHSNRGNVLRRMDRITEAEKDYDQAVSIEKQLAADFPNQPEFRTMLAGSHRNRAALLSDTGRLTEAEQEYDQALSIEKQLATDFPNQPDLRNALAGTCVNLAGLHKKQGNWAAAKRLLLECRPHHLAALKANPQHRTYRQYYRNHLIELTRVHAALLEQQDAVRTAETCRDLGWNAPADAYNAACLLSRCIPIMAEHDKLDDNRRKEAVQFYGDAAMKLLRAAVSKGYKDGAHMKKDTDLAPMRPREDFQKLVAELEGKGT